MMRANAQKVKRSKRSKKVCESKRSNTMKGANVPGYLHRWVFAPFIVFERLLSHTFFERLLLLTF